MELDIRHHAAASRFETRVKGQTALVEYDSSPGRIAFIHTEVPVELEGQGIASALAAHVLRYARDRHLKVIPICPFIVGYIRKHKAAYADILAPGYEGL